MSSDRIGKYRVIAELGQGGMATVLLAITAGPAGFNKLRVLKVLKKELEKDADFLTMFLNEARLAARLNHANVVQTHEVEVENGRHFLVMDYLDGQPLHAVLRQITRPCMPLDIHLRILADVLAGLHYAHTLTDFDGTPLNVVHRDVSPQNVIVTYDGQVKLVDFGIAKASGVTSATQSGVFKGKLAYIAPEQAGGDVIDARADVFSVGVMLWEAMAGRRFASGDSQTTALAKRLAGTEPRVRQVLPDTNQELAEICDRAMAHRPSDRFASARELREALEGFLDRSSRRVSSREVGELVSGLFAQERQHIRSIIDERVKQVLRETTQTPRVPSLEVGGPKDPTPITAIEVPRPIAEAAAQNRLESTPGPFSGARGTLGAAQLAAPPQSPKSPAALALGVFAALALTLIGILTFRARGPMTAAVAPTTTPAPPSDGAESRASADPAAPNEVAIRISVGPAGATAKLDGVLLAENPFSAQVPKDGSMHKVEVEAPGMATQTMIVSFDEDVSLDVTLTAEAASTTVEPVARPPGGVPTGKPDQDGALKIDEEDPYRQ